MKSHVGMKLHVSFAKAFGQGLSTSKFKNTFIKAIWIAKFKLCPSQERLRSLFFFLVVETLLSCRFWKPNVQNIDFISKVISFYSHNYLRMSVLCKIAHAGVDPFNNVPEGPEANGKASLPCGKRRRVFHLFCSGNEN